MSNSIAPDNFTFCGLCERPVRLRWEHITAGLDVGRARCQGCGSCVLSVTGEPDLVAAFLDDLGDYPETIMTLKRWSPGIPRAVSVRPGSQ